MQWVVAGATGPVGTDLVRALLADGDDVRVLSRRPARARKAFPTASVVPWSATPSAEVIEALRSADAVVNLAGTSIGGRPWTPGRKRDIAGSRVAATTALVDAMAALPPAERPSVLVNASGIDYYGDHMDGTFSESSPPGDTFLAGVSVAWERAASTAVGLGVRVVCVRTALVIARDAPAFRLICLPVRAFVGGPLGRGTQPFTWIHISDLAALFRLAATDPTIVGALNAVAPDVRTQAEAVRVIGRILGRPTRVRVPARILRLVMRGQADLLLHGRFAIPGEAAAHGYRFRFATMEAAFGDALGRPPAVGSVPEDSPSAADVLGSESLPTHPIGR